MKNCSIFVVFVVALIICSTSASALKVDAWVYGQVVDSQSGKPIQGAWVSLVDGKEVVQTNANGIYKVEAHVGNYSVKINLGGLLFGGGLSGSDRTQIDTSPKSVMVYAKGYKAFLGTCNVLSVHPRNYSLVLSRIALAPENSDLESSVADASTADLAGPMGSKQTLRVTPSVTTGDTREAGVELTIDVPEELPIDFRVTAMTSTGEKQQLSQVKSDSPGLSRMFRGQVRLPKTTDVVEVVVGAVVTSKLGESSSGRANPYPNLIDLFRGRRTSGTTLIYKSGEVLSVKTCIIVDPAAGGQLQATYDKVAEAYGNTESEDMITELAKNIPTEVIRSTFTSYAALSNLQSVEAARDVEKEIESVLSSMAEKAPGLLLLNRAILCSFIASETGSEPDKTKAAEAISAACKSLSKSGMHMQLLAEAALVSRNFGLAAETYKKASALLGDMDGINIVSLKDPSYHCFSEFLLKKHANEGSGVCSKMAATIDSWVRAEERGSAKDWLNAGKLARDAGLGYLAEEAFRKSISLGESAAAWNYLGLVLINFKKYQEAIAAFRKASDLDAKTPLYRYNLGWTLWLIESYQEALDLLKQARDMNKKDSNYARAYELSSAWAAADSDKSAAELAALMFCLDDVEALPNEVSVSFELAKRCLQEADKPWALWVLAKTEEDPKKADELLAKAAATMPNEPLFETERMLNELYHSRICSSLTHAKSAISKNKAELSVPKELAKPYLESLKYIRNRQLQTAEALVRFCEKAGVCQ